MSSTGLDKVKYLVPSAAVSIKTDENLLGPDCIISHSGVADQKLLNEVDYYWYVSQSNGCVECVVKKLSGMTPTTSNPNCVITKKHRRIEAYCCMICRASFVTVVRALVHFKSVHRTNRKIFIQNLDVFPISSPPSQQSVTLEKKNSSLSSLSSSSFSSAASFPGSCSSIGSNLSAANSTSTLQHAGAAVPPFEHSSLLAEVAEYAKTYTTFRQILEVENALKKRSDAATGASSLSLPGCPSSSSSGVEGKASAGTTAVGRCGLTANSKIFACLAIVRCLFVKFVSLGKIVSLSFADDLGSVTAHFADKSTKTIPTPDLKHDDATDLAANDDEAGAFVDFQLVEGEHDDNDERGSNLKLVPSNPKQAKKMFASFAGNTINMNDFEATVTAATTTTATTSTNDEATAAPGYDNAAAALGKADKGGKSSRSCKLSAAAASQQKTAKFTLGADSSDDEITTSIGQTPTRYNSIGPLDSSSPT